MKTLSEFTDIKLALQQQKQFGKPNDAGLKRLSALLANYHQLVLDLQHCFPSSFDNLANQGIGELQIHLTLLYSARNTAEKIDYYNDFCNYLDASIQDSEAAISLIEN